MAKEQFRKALSVKNSEQGELNENRKTAGGDDAQLPPGMEMNEVRAYATAEGRDEGYGEYHLRYRGATWVVEIYGTTYEGSPDLVMDIDELRPGGKMLPGGRGYQSLQQALSAAVTQVIHPDRDI